MYFHSRRIAVLVHGGAGNGKDRDDGCVAAADRGFRILANGGDALSAAIAAVVALEDDDRFNAGTGSIVRTDGQTIETDAAVMDTRGRLGAVACLRRVKNPVLVARKVADTAHWLLAGDGALQFARGHGFGDWNLKPAAGRGAADTGGCDTVGAVALDGDGTFAVATSTGGASPALPGRVGDTPILGCGFYAGPAGAIALTGGGEHIVSRMVARTVHEDLAAGMPLEQALARAVALTPRAIGLGIIGLTRTEAAAATNRTMPYHLMDSGE